MKSVLFFLSAVIVLAACKKTETQTSREDMLRGKWRQTAGTVTSFYDPTQRDSTTDYWKTVAKCYTDNNITFGEGYSGEASYGKEQCKPTEPQTETLVWQLRSGDTVLEVNGVPAYFFGANPMRGAIQELTASSLKIRYTVDSAVNMSRTKAYTYVNTYTR